MEVAYANTPERYAKEGLVSKILLAVSSGDSTILFEGDKELTLEEAIARLADTDVGPLFREILSSIDE